VSGYISVASPAGIEVKCAIGACPTKNIGCLLPIVLARALSPASLETREKMRYKNLQNK
jgi:hypothetical protein